MSRNTTNPNPASPDSINGTMDSSPVHLTSNFSDDNGSMSLLAPKSTPKVHQNELMLQKGSFTADLGQLGLSRVGHRRGLTEMQRTCVSAPLVQVRTAVNHPSKQNHSVSHTSKVMTVTAVTRTTNLNPLLSTMNGILHQNESAAFQNQEPLVGDSSHNMSNQVNTFHHANPYQSNNAMAIISNQVTCEMQLGQFNKVQPSLTFDNTPIGLHVTGSVDSSKRQNISGSHSQMVKMEDPDVKDEKSEDRYDGITHSIPYRKHGPYTCPRCRRVFDRSQPFAAHMNVHYKTESPAERKRRLAAKYKHRDLGKIDANMRKGTIDPQIELSLAVKVKEEVENP